MNAPPWTIDELGAQVALALSVDYEGAGSGRVRDVPDRRTIRYYTTLGLLDRPAEMRGRTALYSRRHLLQLVAIKRLQAKGRSLAELQAEVVGRSNAQLQRIAKLPDVLEGAAPPEAARPAEPRRAEPRRAAEFWSEPTAPVAEEEKADANPEANPTAAGTVLRDSPLPRYSGGEGRG